MHQTPHPHVEVGLLWVEMLRFYSLEFNMADNVIGVRTNAVLSRELKDWPKKRIAVEGQWFFLINRINLEVDMSILSVFQFGSVL